jgi:hypothetical protein
MRTPVGAVRRLACVTVTVGPPIVKVERTEVDQNFSGSIGDRLSQTDGLKGLARADHIELELVVIQHRGAIRVRRVVIRRCVELGLPGVDNCLRLHGNVARDERSAKRVLCVRYTTRSVLMNEIAGACS